MSINNTFTDPEMEVLLNKAFDWVLSIIDKRVNAYNQRNLVDPVKCFTAMREVDDEFISISVIDL